MKKTLLLATAVASITMAEASTSFNGFYLGAQAGWTQRTTKDQVSETTNGITGYFINATGKTRKNALLYGIMGGWGTTLNGPLYLGIEATLHSDTANKTNKYNFTGSDGSGPWTYSAQYKRGIVLGIVPRIGAVFANTWLAYARLGLEMSRDKITHQYMGGTVNGITFPASQVFNSGTKTKFVFVPGLGVEKAFGNVLTRIEYNYNFGADMRQTTQAYGGGSSVDNQKLSYTAHVVKVGVAYKF